MDPVIARSKWASELTSFSRGMETKMKYLHVFGDEGQMGALMVATDDNVYGIGYNGYWGLLGVLNRPEFVAPEILIPPLSGQKVTCISVGEEVAAAITADGKIFHWGRSLDAPYEVDEYNDVDGALRCGAHQPAGLGVHRFVAVVSGSMFVAGLTTRGQVIMWGLIHERASVVYGHVFPTQQITALSCGSDHIAMLSACGDVLTCGFGSDGQLGRRWSPRERYLLPKPVTLEHHCTRVIQVACGSESTLFLMEDGAVFATGVSDDDFGHLGVPTYKVDYDGIVRYPVRVVTCEKIERIAAAHCEPSIYAAQTERGNIFTWGVAVYPRKLKNETKLISAFYGAPIPPHLGDVMQLRPNPSAQPSGNTSRASTPRIPPPLSSRPDAPAHAGQPSASRPDAPNRAGQPTPNRPAASTRPGQPTTNTPTARPRQPGDCGANVKDFEPKELAAIITDFTELRNEIDNLIKTMGSLQTNSNSKKKKK